MNEIEQQREYYAKTAGRYDSLCCFDKNDEHFIALALLRGLLDHYDIKSILDVGCGTGRGLAYIREKCPDISIKGIEPVRALREEAMRKGIPEQCIEEGDATNINYEDGSFDCVMMFGVLHHIKKPEAAIAEVLRVSKKIVFLSDHNVYGMGSGLTKSVKQAFRDMGMRKVLDFLLTKGKGYHDTTWDGIFYPFSLIDHIPLIQKNVNRIQCFPTKTFSVNIYRDASHLAVLGVKEES